MVQYFTSTREPQESNTADEMSITLSFYSIISHSSCHFIFHFSSLSLPSSCNPCLLSSSVPLALRIPGVALHGDICVRLVEHVADQSLVHRLLLCPLPWTSDSVGPLSLTTCPL